MTYPMSDRDREIQEEPLAAGWEARGELRRPGAARRFPTSKTVGADGGARRSPPSHGCRRTARFHSGPERTAAEDVRVSHQQVRRSERLPMGRSSRHRRADRFDRGTSVAGSSSQPAGPQDCRTASGSTTYATPARP